MAHNSEDYIQILLGHSNKMLQINKLKSLIIYKTNTKTIKYLPDHLTKYHIWECCISIPVYFFRNAAMSSLYRSGFIFA